ncbi:NAD-dependent epimerase/dehydratase family protein [Rhodococcus sp. X156]|uniref:NAD-dependent epimerase/dehydratase family protein n=1 Tax=Rhodococcus sp. X156 TaxID=2499145 RepID=UPI000FD80591|nr:NAD-dependent epimerase/dehydratase family protein [Rhodococcus sp. X156]
MRVVVTGASGNVGTALLRALSADSAEHEVVGICRRPPPDVDPYRGVEWVGTDLSYPFSGEVLERAFAGADAVVHLAWLIQPSYNQPLLHRTNQGGTRRVIDAAVAQGVPHLVYQSSIGVYAPAEQGQVVTESWPHTGVPTSSYSVDKAATEAMLDELDAPGTTVTRVRPGLILQPDAASEIARYFMGPLVPTRLLRPALLRLVPFPPGVNLQFVHADDVADALVRMLHQRAEGAFNLAAEPALDRSTWAAAFGGVGPPLPIGAARAAGKLSWQTRLQPVEPGWVNLAAGAPIMDTTRARTELGWTPQHAADDVVREFVTALAQRRGTLSPALVPRSKDRGSTL